MKLKVNINVYVIYLNVKKQGKYCKRGPERTAGGRYLTVICAAHCVFRRRAKVIIT